MFKRKKYTLKFRKTYHHVGSGTWREVSDSHLMSILLELQEKYGFEIISTKFEDCFSDSYIKIKCNKEDKYKIFGNYCVRLGKYIDSVSF